MKTDTTSLAQALTEDRRSHQRDVAAQHAAPGQEAAPGLEELSKRLRLAIGAEPLLPPGKPDERRRRRAF